MTTTTVPTKAYAAFAPSMPVMPHSIPRRTVDTRDPANKDVAIEILFCGVCHSDLHFARNEWGMTNFPVVPGHEILGRVTAVGGGVSKFKVGDLAAVGCLVDSCRSCPSCSSGEEQFCHKGPIFSYNSPDAKLDVPGAVTFGGYSERIVCDEAFTLKVPANLDPAGAAPLLCAGITTYSPLRRWGAGPGKKVGIVGLGGLGHMGVKFAKAFGAQTCLFTTSAKKAADAKRLGADHTIVSTDPAQMAAHAGTFDLIVDTVSADHDLNAYLAQLKLDGSLVLVGAPPAPQGVSVFSLLMPRRHLSGSLIGGIRQTQEMLDFCGKHNIVSDVEIIPIQKINEAYERMLKSDVKYRFVIDLASLRNA